MDSVKAVDISIVGERNFPQSHLKLPAHLVEDLPELNPLRSGAQPVDDRRNRWARAIWRLGSYRVRQNLLRRIPLRASDFPMPNKQSVGEVLLSPTTREHRRFRGFDLRVAGVSAEPAPMGQPFRQSTVLGPAAR